MKVLLVVNKRYLQRDFNMKNLVVVVIGDITPKSVYISGQE